MEQYISKDSLISEIEKLKKRSMIEDDEYSDGFQYALKLVMSLLAKLKVKEVDLEKEIESYFKGFGKFPSVGIDDCIDIAKHFFELGLRMSKKIKLKESCVSKIKWQPCQFDDICEILINLLHSNDDINKDAIQKDIDWIISIGEALDKNKKHEEKENKDNHKTF